MSAHSDINDHGEALLKLKIGGETFYFDTHTITASCVLVLCASKAQGWMVIMGCVMDVFMSRPHYLVSKVSVLPIFTQDGSLQSGTEVSE